MPNSSSTPCELNSGITKKHLKRQFSGKSGEFKYENEIDLKNEIHKCNITGIAVTTENTLLLCSYNHRAAVLIYRDASIFEKQLKCENMPFDVAVIPGKEKAVVTVPFSEHLQFINTKDLLITERVTIGKYYHNIVADENKIIVGGLGNIKVLTVDGALVREIKLESLKFIVAVAYRKASSDIVCRSCEKVICISCEGNVKFETTIDDEEEAGLTVDGDEDVYLCGRKKNTIQRMSHDRIFCPAVLHSDDKIDHPYTITFNNDFTKLFVVNDCTSVLMYSCKFR